MISVVIPAYRNTDQLVANLKNNLRFLKDCEVIVVDDEPTQSIREVLKEFKSVKLIENVKNLGFGGAVDVGVKQSNSQHVILLNTDVVLHNDSYKKALKHFDTDPNLFAVSFAQKEKNGEIVGKNRIYFARGFLQHSRAKNITAGINGWAEGGACMVDREIFLRLGGFDSLYSPFYWEDVDLSYNAWKAGYKVLFDPAILVEHHHESTIGQYFDKNRVKTIAYRNQFIFMWKNINDKKLCLAHTLFLVPTILVFLMKGEVSFVIGFFGAVTKLPFILKRRLTNHIVQKKSDSEILTQLYV